MIDADRTRRWAIFTGVLLPMAIAISACSTTSDSKQQMSAEQIKTQIIGKSLGYYAGAYSGNITYKQNGKMSYTATGRPYSGTWRLKGDQMCTFLSNNFRAGRETCFDWFETADATYKTGLGYKVWAL